MLRLALVAAWFAASASVALAQAYPTKPIRLMIGYTAGGVAMEAIAKAPADGYTLYYFDSGPLTVAPHLAKVG
jgi:tripartite-type tricarboxylate transporter receptor subunit TctC